MVVQAARHICTWFHQVQNNHPIDGITAKVRVLAALKCEKASGCALRKDCYLGPCLPVGGQESGTGIEAKLQNLG